MVLGIGCSKTEIGQKCNIAGYIEIAEIMALSGEMQAYCDIEDDMVKGMFGTIVQGYLKKGYNRATAEMMAREFFRYES